VTRDPEALLHIALRAADAAHELILSRRPASVTEKSDRDLVSDVDLAVEHAIRGYLSDATPDIGFLGEEEGGSATPGDGWIWTLDPIDGTSNYAHRIPLCAMSLALLHDGRPVLGVIDAPFLGERYHAVEGHGAWAGTRRMTVSGTDSLHDAVVAIGDYAVGAGAGRKNEARLAATVQLTSRVHRIRMLGTAALDLAWLADGRLDASITLGSQPWDIAAGVIIAREAGATVVDADGSPHGPASIATIAAPEPLISKLIPLIQAEDIYTADSQDAVQPSDSPYAVLDAILSRARYLIFDFDGLVCDLSNAMPPTTADQLRAVLGNSVNDASITGTADPTEIIARAATISQEAAARADAELTSIELAAAETAPPVGYIHEALAACRDSGRNAAVISRRSDQAVKSYLARYSLSDQIRYIAATGSYPPGHLQTSSHLIECTVRALSVSPAECAFITTTAANMDIARKTGTHVIGYATTLGASERLAGGGANCIICSLADLTLRLRARPLASSRAR
jgi:myo-inositol-1(or 4)-monophosphatase